MNWIKQNKLLTGIIATVIIAIAISIFYNSCDSRTTTNNVRNDSLETANVVLTLQNFKLQKQKDSLETMILTNIQGTEINRVIYLREKKRIEQQEYSEDYEELLNTLNNEK